MHWTPPNTAIHVMGHTQERTSHDSRSPLGSSLPWRWSRSRSSSSPVAAVTTTTRAAAPGRRATAPPRAGKKGGKLTQLGASDVDFVDPGHTYYTVGFQVIYATQTPLYALKPDDATRPVPDLADGEPQISDDKKTVTVKIKKGVKFGPPVNREVQAKDVKYAFERAATKNVGEPVPGVLQLSSRATPKKPTTGSRTSPASSSTTRTRSRSS